MVGSKSIVAGAVSSAFLVGQVAAYGTFKGLEINGELVEAYNSSMRSQNPAPAVIGWEFHQDPDNAFVSAKKLQDPDIICNKGATPAKTSATVQAGDEVFGIWLNWTESHKGPIITYLARCNGSCTIIDKTKLKFFKIHQEGLLDKEKVPGFWATDALIQNGGRIKIPIPADITPGEYVMRHEIIALHKTNRGYGDGAAQMYPQCLNLIIEGSGFLQPFGWPGTWLYDIDGIQDQGLEFNIGQRASSYPIPGPPIYDEDERLDWLSYRKNRMWRLNGNSEDGEEVDHLFNVYYDGWRRRLRRWPGNWLVRRRKSENK